jgi:hypothetical protein
VNPAEWHTCAWRRKLTAIRSARLHTLAEIVRGGVLFDIGIALEQNSPPISIKTLNRCPVCFAESFMAVGVMAVHYRSDETLSGLPPFRG